jgi:hypothetical protein
MPRHVEADPDFGRKQVERQRAMHIAEREQAEHELEEDER